MALTPRDLSSRTTLETLRGQAKRWLKALQAGDSNAVGRFASAFPGHAGVPRLREVQQALSREYGFASWAALKQEITDRELARRGHGERVALFLEKSALRYGLAPGALDYGNYEADRPARGAMALRLFENHPEIARDSIHTAVAAGDIAAVRTFIANDASLAAQPGPVDGWTPLLRLAYTRLPSEATGRDAVEIASLLLDNGASASDFWSDGRNHFIVLTGAIGGGESNQPPHPRAEDLVRLLLGRGADPLDGQALYNTSLGADDTFWLDLLWAESGRRGETARWRETPRELHGPALDYLLGNAVPNQPKRAAWLLAHGARADATNPHSRRSVVRSAVLNGRRDLAQLLIENGAVEPELTAQEAFVAAIASGEEAQARKLLEGNAAFLADPQPFFIAVRQARPAIARLALALGLSPDVETRDGVRPLHEAAGVNALEIVRLLVEAGAEVDAVERRYGSTPLGWANHNGADAVLAYLAALSGDVCGLCQAARLEQLEVLLQADAGLANTRTRSGLPPLFTLPDDDGQAADVAELLLAAGADATARNPAGLTPADVARQRGLFDTATLLAP
ncbi:ankyrin repeat domain-containing protein [Oryzicola mucosus]|uniref:Ankyrin repeat domain-containing protein n=1 Tax=Oryzicola mucosus TaxID=2767425 RepID=A0A8J6PHV6_9HYPH|nr:ankyrin repeat domain-containing protein [Oryzicola mucosus]MBD0413796.1 hypothetical protein [Oryzicola mucosus]